MINIFCLLLLLPVAGPQAVENLTVLDGGSPSAVRWIDWSDPGLMLVHHLNDLTRACLASRKDEIGKLKSAEDWEKRQAEVRQTLDQTLGPWPTRSPLNARVTDILRKDGYRVEKIVFESMPSFYVTGALFIPEGHSERGPAILDVIGHSAQAFRRDLYQNVILNLVHKGFVVFAIDPIGQGERLQYFDPQSETVFSINRQEAMPLLKKLEDNRQELSDHLPRAVRAAVQLSGYRNPQSAMRPVFQGQYQRDGYRVEKWGLLGEGQTVIPTLVFAPDEPTALATTRVSTRPTII